MVLGFLVRSGLATSTSDALALLDEVDPSVGRRLGEVAEDCLLLLLRPRVIGSFIILTVFFSVLFMFPDSAVRNADKLLIVLGLAFYHLFKNTDHF